MTVAELITMLQTVDPSRPVCLHGYEGGYADVGYLEGIRLMPNVNKEWYYGPHEIDAEGTMEAIVILSGSKADV